MKKIILIASVLLLTGCQTFDNLTYKYGNGILNAINGSGSAIACVSTGGTICATAGAVKGYIGGKQEAREKIVAKADAKLIKKLAEKQATDQGVEVKDCAFLGFWCD